MGLSDGKSVSGSPLILRMIQNLSGSSAMTGRVRLVMGLYFFFWERNRSTKGSRSCDAVDGVSCREKVLQVESGKSQAER